MASRGLGIPRRGGRLADGPGGCPDAVLVEVVVEVRPCRTPAPTPLSDLPDARSTHPPRLRNWPLFTGVTALAAGCSCLDESPSRFSPKGAVGSPDW